MTSRNRSATTSMRGDGLRCCASRSGGFVPFMRTLLELIPAASRGACNFFCGFLRFNAERLYSGSSCFPRHFVPDDGVEGYDELSHDCDDGELWGFTGCSEALV